MGPLTAEGPKPQALPRPRLLCNTRPKAIMYGACQTGPVLSHSHTCSEVPRHTHERPLELCRWLALTKIRMHTQIRSVVLTVHQTAGFPCEVSWELAVRIKVKVRSSVPKPPSGVFILGVHWRHSTAGRLTGRLINEGMFHLTLVSASMD